MSSDKTSFKVSRKLFSKNRSIQKAIDEAPVGSTIEIEPGVYREDLVIDKYIELVGVGDREQIVIQGIKSSSITMKNGYAVIRNVTIKQPKELGFDKGMDTVYIENGTLLLESCKVISDKGPAISIDGETAEPIIRYCEIISTKNSAVLNKGTGNIIFERCHFASQSKENPVIHILDGNPQFKKCKIVGTESKSCGIYVEGKGKGRFEECNIYGFDHEAAIYIKQASPSFYRCKIHDGKHCGIVIRKGKGVFKKCSIFSFEKDAPAIRISDGSSPFFQESSIRNCKGGGIIFEEDSGGLIDKCDLFGFIYQPAIRIFEGANPMILHTKIHDGNVEGVVSTSNGKGALRDCELFSFNSNIISVTNGGQLDVLNCKVYKGNKHGIYYSQKTKGIVQDTQISQFSQAAAIHVSKAADPSFIQCQVFDSEKGVQVHEHGRGKFERCVFWDIEAEVWEVQDSDPAIYLCKEMNKENGSYQMSDSEYSDPLLISNPRVNELFEQVEKQIGQWKVKAKMKEVIHYLDYLQDRKRLGIKTMEELTIHGLFLGPSDTGKEKMADLYAQMLKEIGLVSEGHLVTVTPDQLANPDPFIMQQVLQQRIEEALGGVLYLDQIHLFTQELTSQTLLPGLQQIFNHLVPETAVIISGPEEQVRAWLETWPDLKKFFTHEYFFEEYSPEDMVSIFLQIAKEEDYQVHETCMSLLLKEMHQLWSQDDQKSCVERVREYFKMVQVVQSRRCAKLPKSQRTKEALTTIMPEDLTWKGEKDIQPGDKEWMQELEKYYIKKDESGE
ncbi:right-handed parallel beta-helix repeat-containing protein [Thermoflavimicrobium dichotomicum]|uniref:Right handed beta helix region n=1 Tax=Thermoflavimicrobium dichotomicum TaxID=46223 RepID=A0A1I3QIK1_9BACL|nr:right-handed parallel beta-helix repeat-containing protein [Thermoflavimicrobium dichotomicum]SFJ33016.1 Right handed beta helix region [Thermoflavimicrobium dichotomicum]